jgi:serine/threonine-protein phosphatase 2A regulatory subunit B
MKPVTQFNLGNKSGPKSLKSSADLLVPNMDTSKETVNFSYVPRRVYANAHAYHINSISLNSDGETYISSDDLRINLWNLSISDQSFSKSTNIRMIN